MGVVNVLFLDLVFVFDVDVQELLDVFGFRYFCLYFEYEVGIENVELNFKMNVYGG